jgi:hypothetical protein
MIHYITYNMDTTRGTFGNIGTLLGATVPLAIVSAAFARPPSSYWDDASARTHVVADAPAWRPWIDDPDGRRLLADPPHCRSGVRRGIVPVLDEAPLPGAYDPKDGLRELYACILVAPDGRAAAVRLTGTSGRRAVDAMLVATILDAWRFIAGSSRPEWVRVRLTDNLGAASLRF